MDEAISRQVLDLWNRYRPTIAVDAIEYDRELKKLLGTNLAEVGKDLISRQAAIDALKQQADTMSRWSERYAEQAKGVLTAVNIVEDLPSAQPYTIHSDGRLWITVDDIDKVTAVVVDEHKSKFCKQFYEDAGPDNIRCKDCKHWIPYDWMFSEVWQSQNIDDYPEDEIGCNIGDMAMKANDFCSRAEKREDG